MATLKIAAIGECMIELWQDPQQPTLMQRTFGGDTLNTAVYAARCLKNQAAQVDFVTALGTDPFSEELLQSWQREAIGTDLVLQFPSHLPGLYIIRTAEDGERTFYYWRENAAVRQLFNHPQFDTVAATLAHYDFVYLSAITLAILDDHSRQQLLKLLRNVREHGGRVGFDSNYRPHLWPDAATTRHWFEQVLAHTDMAFPTLSDEQALFTDRCAKDTAQRYHDTGVSEVVVKCGAEPCFISSATSHSDYIAGETITDVIDTTAAGDAFNAAYFSARLCAAPQAEAATAGHRLAARVIQHRGAIIPRQYA